MRIGSTCRLVAIAIIVLAIQCGYAEDKRRKDLYLDGHAAHDVLDAILLSLGTANSAGVEIYIDAVLIEWKRAVVTFRAETKEAAHRFLLALQVTSAFSASEDDFSKYSILKRGGTWNGELVVRLRTGPDERSMRASRLDPPIEARLRHALDAVSDQSATLRLYKVQARLCRSIRTRTPGQH